MTPKYFIWKKKENQVLFQTGQNIGKNYNCPCVIFHLYFYKETNTVRLTGEDLAAVLLDIGATMRDKSVDTLP